MTAYISGEISIFLWSLISGIIIMVAYDIFSVLTNSKNPSIFVCNIFDGIFVLSATAIMIFMMLNISNGYIRGFEFIGVAIGGFMYKIILSRFFKTIFTKIISVILAFFQFFSKILLTPMRFMYKIMYNSIVMLIRFIGMIILPLKRQLLLIKISLKKT